MDSSASRSKGNYISVIIGASLGGAVCFLFLAYVVRMGIQHAHKEMIKQKNLDDYFKRLDLLKENSSDATVLIPMMMVPERYRKRGGAHISTSPTNSSTRRNARNRVTNDPDFSSSVAKSGTPGSVVEESVASSYSNSLHSSCDISSIHTSEQSSAQSALLNSSNQSRENLLEEGRMVASEKNWSYYGVESDVGPSLDSERSCASESFCADENSCSDIDGADIQSSNFSVQQISISDMNVSSEGGKNTASDSNSESGVENGTDSGYESLTESVEQSTFGSREGAQSLEEEASFQDLEPAMSDEFNSEASSQNNDWVEFSV